MATLLRHFDALTDNGLQVIPLRENSKIPRLKKWSSCWNRDQCRFMLRKYPYSNIGILLGMIVDVEGDSPEANRTINRLVGDYPHPTYRSARSTHHLFLSPDPELRLLKHQDLEFRGYGHQSVLPPSRCNGVQYAWLDAFKFPVPEMPNDLRLHYWKLKNGNKDTIKPGHRRIRCIECNKRKFIHKKRLKLEIEAFKLLGERWSCQSCRQHDLRPACRAIRLQLP